MRYGSTTSSMVSIGSLTGGRHRGQTHRPAAVVLGDGTQQLAVHGVQTALVDLQQGRAHRPPAPVTRPSPPPRTWA